jgi:murein L,D-transpeptidase YcbB/YkuD
MSFGRMRLWAFVCAGMVTFVTPVLAAASQAMVQSLAEAAQSNEIIANFYQARKYQPLWTNDAPRLNALMAAFDAAPAHGLPIARYDAVALRARAEAAHIEGDLARLDVALTEAYLSYAHDISSGALDPSAIDPAILREIIRPDPATLLTAIAVTKDPAAYLQGLMPASANYTALMVEKAALEAKIAAGGWGAEILGRSLRPKDNGPSVIELRERLVVLGYLAPTATAVYDAAITRAVQRFQAEQGLISDGVAGLSTVAALNAAPQTRLQSVIVALERLRWMGNVPLGKRHIWVNQPDFTVKIFDDGRETFRSRVVIGKNVPDQRSPEFSDQMEYMAVNPSWGVPRSIIVKEYLPLLQKNPNAVGHLQVIDGKGRVVSRDAVNFAAYSGKTFPFSLRQPPSDGNALGKVKFMFPNSNNIYLHDTPAKNLFANEVRAYSHGCIRVGAPEDFAFVLLGAQSDDPKGQYQAALATGNETNIALTMPVPVHLVYFTAFPNANGVVTYRNDVYGRDGKLFEALKKAGLESMAETG